MQLRRFVLLGTATLAVAAAAQTQPIPESAYRRGMPEVLTPAPAPVVAAEPGFDRASFAAAYARAGRPTIAVLWNREFTDMLQQQTAQQLAIDHVRAGGASRETVRMPGYTGTEAVAAGASSTTITSRDVKTEQGRRSGPVERTDLEMRSAFMQTMTASGVRLVDRNVVMRTTAAASKGSLDTQQVETQALSKHARLMMEVLNTRDPAAATGWSTYVSIKRLSDGVVLAEGYMNGQEAQPAVPHTPKFEADPRGGFREVARPARTVTDVGRLVAQQTLARLAGAL